MVRISGWRVIVAAVLLAATSTSANAATISIDLTASPAGFTAQNLGSGTNTWFWTSAGWQVNGSNVTSVQRLLTPVFTADASSFGVVLTHRFSFEDGFGVAFDGGQVLVSVNGGAFTLLDSPSSPYTHTFSAFSPRTGPAFGDTSAGYLTPAFITSTFSGPTTPGTTFQFAFDGAWDISVNPANEPDWHLTNLELRDFASPAAAVPEPSTWLLFATGLAALAGRRRRTRRT